jgi:hypothetical protein
MHNAHDIALVNLIILLSLIALLVLFIIGWYALGAGIGLAKRGYDRTSGRQRNQDEDWEDDYEQHDYEEDDDEEPRRGVNGVSTPTRPKPEPV